MQAIAESVMEHQRRLHERQVEELKAHMHLQSSGQLKELNALFARQSEELRTLGAELMDRLATQADRVGDAVGEERHQLGRGALPLEGQRQEFKSHEDQPAVVQATLAGAEREGRAGAVGNLYVDYDASSERAFESEAVNARSGCGRDAAARGVTSDGDESDDGRQSGGVQPARGGGSLGGERGGDGCNRTAARPPRSGTSSSSGLCGRSSGGGGLDEGRVQLPRPPVPSGRGQRESESDAQDSAASGHRGREDDDWSADAWLNAVKELRFVMAEEGPLATLRRACEITGWSHSLKSRRSGGRFVCEARLTDDDLELHAATLAGARAREVRHGAVKALLSACVGRMVAHSAVAGLREG